MSRTKEVGTAVGTLACALSIGFAMQSTETASQRYGATIAKEDSDARAQLDIQQVAVVGSSFMDVHDIMLTSALGDKRPVADSKDSIQKASAPNAFEKNNPPRALVIKPFGTCAAEASATTLQAAFVQLSLEATCRANETVTIHHSGMMFTETTDSAGKLQIKVPALSKSAVFFFGFESGEGAVAHTVVDDITSYKRVVLQWRDKADFQLHAREFGAEDGESGHVWRESRASVAKMLNGDGGFLTSLGSGVSPLKAEIYSFPATSSARDGQIDLSIEAFVSESNCGSNVEAQTFEWDGVSQLRSKSVSFEMPTCDAVGEYLVLNNVLDDLKVASK